MKKNRLNTSLISFDEDRLELCIGFVFEVGIVVAHYEDGLELMLASLSGALTFLLTFTFIISKKFRKQKIIIDNYANQIEYLQEINNVENEKLKNFILDNLISSVLQNYKNFVSGSELICSYSVQLQIADRISENVNQYFWATSLDSPSQLWAVGGHYFGTLEKLKIDCGVDTIPSKARIVLISYENLLNDYEINYDAFQKFIKWHIDNNWGLRFYQKSIEDIHKIFEMNIEPPIIKDFLVKDDHCVYGRISNEKESTVKIQLILNNPIKIEEYKNFFETIWHQSEDANEVNSKMTLKISQKPKIERILNEFPDFRSKVFGKEFFNLVCSKIESATNTIYAVDIADLKNVNEVKIWKFNNEYLSFIKACIIASDNNAEVTRIFVLKDFMCLSNNDVKEVMLDQLRANFSLGFVKDADCSKKSLCKEDFILVDNIFGFKLIQQDFNIEELAIENNLISKNELSVYGNKFNQIQKYVKDNDLYFKGMKDIEKFNNFVVIHNKSK
jgi:hypothetical protein